MQGPKTRAAAKRSRNHTAVPNEIASASIASVSKSRRTDPPRNLPQCVVDALAAYCRSVQCRKPANSEHSVEGLSRRVEDAVVMERRASGLSHDRYAVPSWGKESSTLMHYLLAGHLPKAVFDTLLPYLAEGEITRAFAAHNRQGNTPWHLVAGENDSFPPWLKNRYASFGTLWEDWVNSTPMHVWEEFHTGRPTYAHVVFSHIPDQARCALLRRLPAGALFDNALASTILHRAATDTTTALPWSRTSEGNGPGRLVECVVERLVDEVNEQNPDARRYLANSFAALCAFDAAQHGGTYLLARPDPEDVSPSSSVLLEPMREALEGNVTIHLSTHVPHVVGAFARRGAPGLKALRSLVAGDPCYGAAAPDAPRLLINTSKRVMWLLETLSESVALRTQEDFAAFNGCIDLLFKGLPASASSVSYQSPTAAYKLARMLPLRFCELWGREKGPFQTLYLAFTVEALLAKVPTFAPQALWELLFPAPHGETPFGLEDVLSTPEAPPSIDRPRSVAEQVALSGDLELVDVFFYAVSKLKPTCRETPSPPSALEVCLEALADYGQTTLRLPDYYSQVFVAKAFDHLPMESAPRSRLLDYVANRGLFGIITELIRRQCGANLSIDAIRKIAVCPAACPFNAWLEHEAATAPRAVQQECVLALLRDARQSKARIRSLLSRHDLRPVWAPTFAQHDVVRQILLQPRTRHTGPIVSAPEYTLFFHADPESFASVRQTDGLRRKFLETLGTACRRAHDGDDAGAALLRLASALAIMLLFWSDNPRDLLLEALKALSPRPEVCLWENGARNVDWVPLADPHMLWRRLWYGSTDDSEFSYAGKRYEDRPGALVRAWYGDVRGLWAVLHACDPVATAEACANAPFVPKTPLVNAGRCDVCMGEQLVVLSMHPSTSGPRHSVCPVCVRAMGNAQCPCCRGSTELNYTHKESPVVVREVPTFWGAFIERDEEDSGGVETDGGDSSDADSTDSDTESIESSDTEGLVHID